MIRDLFEGNSHSSPTRDPYFPVFPRGLPMPVH